MSVTQNSLPEGLRYIARSFASTFFPCGNVLGQANDFRSFHITVEERRQLSTGSLVGQLDNVREGIWVSRYSKLLVHGPQQCLKAVLTFTGLLDLRIERKSSHKASAI